MNTLYAALTADGNVLFDKVVDNAGLSSDDVVDIVRAACEDIDTLTFNRITDFFALTEFQQNTVLRACSRFIRFKADNAELLNSVIKSYSISGVSLSFDDTSVKQIDGVYVPGDVYGLLRQSGLTCRVL